MEAIFSEDASPTINSCQATPSRDNHLRNDFVPTSTNPNETVTSNQEASPCSPSVTPNRPNGYLQEVIPSSFTPLLPISLQPSDHVSDSTTTASSSSLRGHGRHMGDSTTSAASRQVYGMGHKLLLAGKTRNSGVSNSHSQSLKRKRKRTETFALYIYKVLKSVHTETGIGRNSMSIMNSFINDIFDRLCTEGVRLLSMSKKRTLTKNEMRTAARLVIPGELYKHAHDEATTAVNKFEAVRESGHGFASLNNRSMPPVYN